MKPSTWIISCPAMYASCASAQRTASSRGIDWFCPSGASVTTNVERFERDATLVVTLRLPYAVGRALGILAVSSLTSSGLGLSITRAAFGGRNSIFATCGSFVEDGKSYRRRYEPIRTNALPGGSDSFPV